MPELPEVETVVRQLRRKVVGKRIKRVTTLDENIVCALSAKLKSVSITSISRRGKYILFSLSNNKTLLAHLRMTGHFSFFKDGRMPKELTTKHLAGLFRFSDGSLLTYNTIRKFGGMKLLSQKELQAKLCTLGHEPLAKSFTPQKLASTLSQFPHANIKNKLLDQTCIAGVGNIYALEALYRAGINPSQKISDIHEKKLQGLHGALQSVLQQSIKNNGTTVSNYNHIDGKGSFQNLLAVYGKESCPQGHAVAKMKQAGRGSYFCETCQS